MKLEVIELRQHFRELSKARFESAELAIAQAHFDNVLAPKRNEAEAGPGISHHA
ncbi:MAG: hypothetical protein QNJ85_07885 [Gammaproteobacteria bacterium]|nr:hypothetical protein [Gammaproteobacteria bacterium]